MTGPGWALTALLLALCFFFAWRWRLTERRRQRLWLDALAAREQAGQAGKEQARLAAYLRAIAQTDTAAVYLLDQTRTVLWANAAAGAQDARPLSTPLPLSHAASSFELLEVVAQAQADALPHERQFLHMGQTYHAVARRLADPSDHILLTVSDVTELQRLGRARRDFVANISHDLRTPITAIQVMIETLLSGAANSPKRQQQLLSGIADQTATLRQLAQEMLDLSLIESGRMPIRLVETPLCDLIAPVIKQLRPQAEHKEIKVHEDYEPQWQALADPDSIRRTLQNLLHNAIKFTPQGGEVWVQAFDEGEDVRIAVRDTGPGIDPADVNRIFERFYKADRTRSEGGTGLGLAIARHIVEGHGGRIWVENQPGRGASFSFTLPKA